MLVDMSHSPSSRLPGLVRNTAVTVAVLVGCACSPPQEEQNAAVGEPEPSASASETPSRFTELTPDATTRAQLDEGLSVAVQNFERTHDARGNPALVFDVTLTNTTGQEFDSSRVAVHAFHGPESEEGSPAIMEFDDNGAGRSAYFEQLIPDGQEETVTYGFVVDADHEELMVLVAPEGIDPVFLSGLLPT